MRIHRESTEFLFVGVTGDQPSVSAEVAFMEAGQRPDELDWLVAILVSGPGHQLWQDAVASGLSGDYYLAVLVGSYGDNTLVLDPGEYQMWLRLTDAVERLVRIAPAAVEVL